MTYKQVAGRLRGLAAQKPTDIYRELLALAGELECTPEPVCGHGSLADEDIEALVRATQPATRPRRLGSIVPWRRR